MKGALLALVVVAVAACSTSVVLPLQPGPVIPNGAHSIDVTFRGAGAYGCGVAPSIVAGPSLEDVKIPVIQRCRSQCITPGLACWAQLPDQPDDFYFAVYTVNECARPVRELAAVRGSTLYFIHFIGKPAGVCDAALMQPAYRLFTSTRSVLPASGKVTVELQVEDVNTGTSTYDAEANLG
ncbi:MAG TPA: hypothetical protein VI384_00730 [Candidatus Dormibacteraeota bacterium]